MLKSIQNQIEVEAKKRLNKFNKKQRILNKHRHLFEKRTGLLPSGAEKKFTPISNDKHFDPYYCIKHCKFLAKGIYKSLLSGKYEPKQAVRIQKKKPNGKYRNIDVFSIPDAAVSKIFLNNLRKRNEKLLSDSSFAYSTSKTPLDAVIRLKNILGIDKIFISQYDFSDYFGSINHNLLFSLIKNNGKFLITNVERKFIKSTISYRFNILNTKQIGENHTGIPQGNSISLFIANIFADKLDSDLRFSSGEFVRFADDSVVINGSYEDAIKCYNIYKNYSKQNSININDDKSSGINLYSSSEGEIRTINNFTFLGYKFTYNSIDISDKTISRIKNKCYKIIYNNLLLHPKRVKTINKKRIGKKFIDWELVTCVNELRRYIYGGHSEQEVNAFIHGKSSINKFHNTISYFCLSENVATLKALDGWLVSTVYNLHRERVEFLTGCGFKLGKVNREKIITGEWYDFDKIPNETKLPSFYFAWRAAKRSWALHGLHGVHSRYKYGYDDT